MEWLRKKGLSGADKKAGRVAAEGVIAAYIHPGSRLGVLLEVGQTGEGSDRASLWTHGTLMRNSWRRSPSGSGWRSVSHGQGRAAPI